MPDFVWMQNVVLPILGMGIGVWVLYNGFRIAKHSIDRHHERELAKSGGKPEELAQLRERVERLEDMGYRVQELEERVDFTERVLTSRRGPDGAAP
jgi:divalent metal cation (Fe/Co/Zn/Cd) transporter